MKRKLLFITLLMMFCTTMFGQQHWTMTNTDIVKYNFNMTVFADIKIGGETPDNISDIEIAAFHDGILRGVAKPVYKSMLGQYIAELLVYGNDYGDNITFKVFDPNEGKEYDTDYVIKFQEEDVGLSLYPVEMNFYSMHWSYINVNENYMAYPCIIKIDGVEQTNPNLELAAFINNELRGVARPKLEEAINIYIANLMIDGNNGQEISFKLYVPEVGELETDYTAIYDIDYDKGLVTLEFRNNPVAKIVRNEITHYFASLAAAVAAAQPGETVVLLQDVNLTETLTIEKNITLDLNDKNVTLSTGGNMIKSNVIIRNGNLAIADVDTKETANKNCFISTNGGSSLTFDDINMTGNGYTTHWAVLCAMGSTAGTGSTINITNSTITLSNEKGSQGGFIKDQSGVDNYSQINISNSTLTLTNVSRGFTGAKVTLDDVEMTITGGEHGINGSELVIKNGSNVSISNGTGRAITLNEFDASIAGSNVTISNMREGGIRYKTANTLTVDASSTLSETTAHADVDNAKLNDKVVRGTELQKSTVKVEGGVTTVINPVSGQVAYRAYINDSDTREAIQVDLQNVNALRSLAVKLYDANGNLLTTTTYKAGAVEAPEYLTCNIVLWGEASSSWETTIHADELTVENIPYKIELVVDDDNVIHTFDNALGAGTGNDETAKYIALDCVLDIPVAKVGNKEYYTIDKAVANWTNNTTLTLLANVTLSKAIEIKSEETHTLDLGTFTMTAAEGYNAIEIMPATNRYGKFTINADATNPGGITANGKNCIHYNNTTSNDLPTITINGGVFNGNYSIYCNKTKTPRGDSPKVVVNNGTFNGIVKVTYGALYVYDGYFDAEVTCTGADDGHGQRLIVGGTFKKWGFMTADAPSKFTVGSTWGTYDVGVYVDDNGYLVVGGDVVTEPGETFEASANHKGWSGYVNHGYDYLKYSSAAANNLYYTSVEQAFADNTSSNSSVNIFTDELDLTQLTYNGTLVIADDFTVTFAEGNEPKIQSAEGLDLGYTETVENGIVTRVYSVGNFVAAIGTAKYATLADAIAAAQAGETIDLLDNYSETLLEVLLIDKSLTINGNGKTLTSSATRVIRLTASEIEVTINNLNMVSEAVRVGTNDIRGISIDASLSNVTLELNECSVDFIDESATDWSYAVNVSGNGTGHNVTVDGGSYEGANVVNANGASNTVTVKNATLTSLYPANEVYYGACIWVLEENGSSVEATGNTLNGGNAVAFNLGTGTDLTESNNTDNTTKVIAKIGNELYVSLQEAIDAATEDAPIVVLHNIELTQGVVVAADKTFTLDLNGKTITGTPTEAAAFAVIKNSGNLTITDDTEAKDGKILCNHNLAPSTGYAVNTITNNGTLTVVAGTIENKSTYTSSNQIGYAIDNYSGAAVVIKGGKVTASGSVYYDGIRQFCNSETLENNVTIEDGEVSTLWIQNPSNDNVTAVKGSFDITGGTLGNLYLEPSANFSGSISDGHVGNISRHQTAEGRDLESFITGGTFGMDVTEFCAFNYVCTSNGDGTYGIEYKQQENNAFVISTLHELEAFRDAVNAGNDFAGQTVVLSAGVDLNPTRAINIWEPIGTQANPFRGTFDGGDNTISNLVVVGENNVGLFGYADNATIKNVKLENVNVKGTDCVGAIAGQVYSTSLIDNCHVSGSIKVEGQTNVGGIVGKYYTKVKNCSVIGDGVATSYVKGTHKAENFEGDNIGGIMGHGGENNTFTNNTVKNITISGTRKVGGIVGVTDQNTDVTNCLVENVNIETTAKAEYAQANAAKAGHASIVGSYTKLGANNNGTVTNCVVKNVTFVNNDNVTMSAGPITGGAREGMVDPTGVTASGNLIYMSTITGNTTNMYLMNAVAMIGETKYYTLQDAVDAGDGETINVILSTTEDINIADGATITLTFADDVTLNGYIAPFNGNLTVNGGTINNTNSAKSAVQINAGKLELNNVNITSARHAMRIEGTNGEVIATINGGTYKLHEVASQTQHVLNAGGDGSQVTVTINNGTFVGPKGTASDSGAAINVQNNASVTINGGDFSGGKNHTLSAAGTLIVKGGTFDQVVKGSYLADGYVCQMNADNKYEVFFAVAKIGEVNYPSLQKAFNDVDANETITIISNVEESEVILPATLENVIVTASENVVVKNTVIKTPEMGTTSGFAIAYEGLTFNNVNFDNSRVHLTGWANDALSQSVSIKNLVVTNCEFNNIANEENQNYAALHLNVADGVLENLTFTNNKVNGITGGESAALYGNFTGDVTITGNVIRSTSGSSMVVGYSNATIIITDNILENWALSGKGRAIRLDVNNEANASTVEVRGNAMIYANAPEEFVKSTGSNTTVTLNENYWYGNSPREEGMVTAAGVVIDNYYKTCTVSDDDFELDNLVVYAKGTITHGYVNTYKIWGEGSSNSQVSFVVKVYAGETLLGQASLNDKDNIIDGDIPNVTWGIPYNTANTDEYWTVEWFEALSPSVVPTTVKLYVDGEFVAENTIKMNAPDDLNPIEWEDIFVAKIEDNYYTSLQDAVNVGGEVTVLQNITLTETVTIEADKTVTLDLNGKTISAGATFAVKAIVNNGTLTINGNGGTIDISASTTESIQVVDNYGTLTINGGTYKGATSNYSYAIRANDANSVTNIVDATITTHFGAIGINKGVTTITDGKFEVTSQAGGHALYVVNAEVTINGGEFIPYANGYSYAVLTNDANAKVSITGGTFKKGLGDSCVKALSGNIIITGGTFATDVNGYCHEYYDAIQGDDNLWTVEQVLFAQTTSLQGGWNWYSSYVDIDGATGLSLIQSALGSNGVQIKNPETGRFSQYSVNPNTLEAIWSGSLRETSSSDIYAIRTLGGEEITHNIEIVSAKLDPADPSNTVTIRRGWNYVAYPLDVQLSINAALGFTPTDGDVIKSKDQSSIYFGTWVGQLTNMIPGQGYMYQSYNSSIMEFNFEYPSTNNRESTVLNIEAIDYYWNVDAHNYSGNMTMIAMLETNDEIMQDGYEIAAFANGECRGTARPVYVESVDAYILVFTVNGEDVEELSFKCYDVNTGVEYNLNNRINYSNDAVVGSIDEPYMFNLDMLNIGETSVENISIYPNPTTTGREIQLQAVCDKVEVFNALGVKIAEYSNVDSIDAIETAGVYVIRLTIDNSARNCRLIVK